MCWNFWYLQWLTNSLCILNKTEALNIHVFNMIAAMNEASCECKCKFGGRKCNADYKWNNDKCWYGCKRDYICNPASCSCKNSNYLASIVDDSVITCDEIIKETKTFPTSFNEKNVTCKTKNLYILLAFLLITIAFLLAVSITLTW